MSTEIMLKVLTAEGFKFTKKECCICYEKFIENISFDELIKIFYNLFKEKYNIEENEFFGEEPVRCYNDRVECKTCLSIVCDTCLQNIPDKDGAIGDYNIDEFICPVCRSNYKK